MNTIEKALLEAQGGEELVAESREQERLDELTAMYGTMDPSWQQLATRRHGCRLGNDRKNHVNCIDCKLTCSLDLGDMTTVWSIFTDAYVMDTMLLQAPLVEVNGVKLNAVVNQLAILVCNKADKVFNGKIDDPEAIIPLLNVCSHLEWEWLYDALDEVYNYYEYDWDMTPDEDIDDMFMSAAELGLDLG